MTVPGYVPDIRPRLDARRLFVLPSHLEGYHSVIVVRCTAAVDELLGARSIGTSVPIGDTRALTRAIRDRLARPAPDPARVVAIVAHHRIGAVVQIYLRLFRGLGPARATA